MSKIFTPIRKLHISVIFGWTVLFSLFIVGLVDGGWSSAVSSLQLTLIILAIRYSLIKPVELLGAAFAGWMTVTIIEWLANSRNAVRPETFIITIILVFAFALIKGIILAAFFLLRETYQLVLYHMNKSRFQHI